MAKFTSNKRSRRSTPTVQARKGSKLAIVIPIVEKYLANEDDFEPGEVVQEIMEKADMSVAGARTYLYNVKHRLQAE